MCIFLWLFPVAYVGQWEGLHKLVAIDNLIAPLLATAFIVLLAGAFLFIRIWKQLAKRKRKSVWEIVRIHIMVVVIEYLLLNMLAKDARLSALSILFQIVSVGLSRALAARNMVFVVVLPVNAGLTK